MKTSILSLFLILSTTCLAQNAMYDAIKLSAYLEPNKNGKTVYKFKAAHDREVLAIMSNYVSDASSLGDLLFHNPFISSRQAYSLVYMPDNIYSEDLELLSRRDISPQVARIPGMRVANIADGLARFLAKRTKEELTEAFFRSFQRRIQQDPYLRTLFPQTTGALSLVGEEVYQLDRYLDMLRSSFLTDANLMPSHLRRGLEDQDWLAKAPEFQTMAKDLLSVGQSLVDAQKPVEMISFLGTQAAIHEWKTLSDLEPAAKSRLANLSASLQTLDLISNSVRAPNGSNDWLPASDIDLALRNDKIRFLYLGLMHLQSQRIAFDEGRYKLQEGFTQLAQSTVAITQFFRILRRFTETSDRIQSDRSAMTALRNTDAPEAQSYDRYYAYLTDAVSLVSTGLEIRRLLLPQSGTDHMEQKFLHTLENTTRLYLNIRQGRYIYAIMNVANILDEIIPQDQFKASHREAFMRYGTFLASTCEARTGEELAQIIEYFAMPVGGSTLKKKTKFSISLNAYTGLTSGVQYLKTTSNYTYGAVSAPLGPAFNWSLRQRHGSFSAYVQLIDVGAITAFRFTNTSTTLPALDWRNIVSPGFYFVYGFWNHLPISVGFGASKGPALQKVTVNGLEINDSGYKINGFIGVDIPLVHVYTRR